MNKFFLLSLVMSFLTACTSKPTSEIDFNPSTNFKKFATYQFCPDSNASLDANPIMIYRIRSAIDQALGSKGLTKHNFINKNSADITIHVNFTEQEKENDPAFSIGLGTSVLGGNARSNIGFNADLPVNSTPSKITKIIIDISDSSQVIWHGSDSYETKKELTVKQKDKKVNTIVKALLANFPPN